MEKGDADRETSVVCHYPFPFVVIVRSRECFFFFFFNLVDLKRSSNISWKIIENHNAKVILSVVCV